MLPSISSLGCSTLTLSAVQLAEKAAPKGCDAGAMVCGTPQAMPQLRMGSRCKVLWYRRFALRRDA